MTPAEEHDMRIDCEGRLTRLETKISVVCQKCDAIFRVLRSMQTDADKRRVDIAVLKTKAALYGSIAAIVVSPIVAIAIHLLTAK